MEKKKKNYIDSEELDKEMEKYAETGVISERLGSLLLDLHDHILQHRNFRGYRQDLKDEMKSYSLLRIVKCGLKSYNPKRGCKAFSYLTRGIFQNYITIISRYYKKLNNHQEWLRNELAQIPPNDPIWRGFAKEFDLSYSQDVIVPDEFS